jgi:hypothetical protein
MIYGGMNCKRRPAPLIFSEVLLHRRARAHTSFLFRSSSPYLLPPRRSADIGKPHTKIIAPIQPFVHSAPLNPSGINTSEKFPISRISLIRHDFNFTRINTSGNKDLKPIIINTSGSKDLKSFRISTSKKQGRGDGCAAISRPSTKISARAMIRKDSLEHVSRIKESIARAECGVRF